MPVVRAQMLTSYRQMSDNTGSHMRGLTEINCGWFCDASASSQKFIAVIGKQSVEWISDEKVAE